MATYRLWKAGWAALLVAGLTPAVWAAPPAPSKQPAAADAQARDVAALAAKIDQHLVSRWTAAKIEPARPADDAEFLRRVYLDVTGRIPSVSEARTFLKDTRPDKRRRLVDQLLSSPSYVNHSTNIWRSLWMAEANTSFIGRYLTPGFEVWLRQELAKNAGYDQMVREILTTPISQDSMNAFNFYGNQGNPNPVAFYLTKEAKPENLAASTARMFLGVRLECAQCHDHPFATWKREQFWGMAAFFAGIQRQEQGDFVFPTREIGDRRELLIPGSERIIQAGFIDGSEPQWKFRVGSRVTLADWVTSPSNPYFARAAVNRVWAQFFGIGLTEPVDDMLGSETQAHNPELLDDLAREFAAHKFDLKFLIRAITASRAYQLTSETTPYSSAPPHLFSRMPIKGMSGEQLFDSLVVALGFQEQRQDPRFFGFNDNTPRAKFLEKFANRSDKPTESHTSILQALALMNSQFIAEATTVERSELLAAVADSPFMNPAQKIETLYLATLGRKPRPEETDRLVKYVERGGTGEVTAVAFAESLKNLVDRGPGGTKVATKKDHALADVLWALLNSSEFVLNH
jgi:hypothetical protein